MPVPSFDYLMEPGERLIWSGQPKQGPRFQPGDGFLLPFGLFWLGASLFWEASALDLVHPGTGSSEGTSLTFALFGLPILLIGCYLVFGRYYFDAAQRGKTLYILTDHRAIVWRWLVSQSVQSVDLCSLSNLNLAERHDHSGDILFGQPGAHAAAPWPMGGHVVPGFYQVPDARELYNRIREARQVAR